MKKIFWYVVAIALGLLLGLGSAYLAQRYDLPTWAIVAIVSTLLVVLAVLAYIAFLRTARGQRFLLWYFTKKALVEFQHWPRLKMRLGNAKVRFGSWLKRKWHRLRARRRLFAMRSRAKHSWYRKTRAYLKRSRRCNVRRSRRWYGACRTRARKMSDGFRANEGVGTWLPAIIRTIIIVTVIILLANLLPWPTVGLPITTIIVGLLAFALLVTAFRSQRKWAWYAAAAAMIAFILLVSYPGVKSYIRWPEREVLMAKAEARPQRSVFEEDRDRILRTKLITVGPEWTPWQEIPPGERLRPTRLDPTVGYEYEVPGMAEPGYVPPMEPGKEDTWTLRTPDSDVVRFRLLDPDASETKMSLVYRPYKKP